MSKRKITLRKAELTDFSVLQEWDNQPHIKNAFGSDSLYNWKTYLKDNNSWSELFIAEMKERKLGFVGIIDPHLEKTNYWGICDPEIRALDIWIGNKDDLGKGYGTAIMNLALKYCFSQDNIQTVLVDPLSSNVNAHQFFEKLGFQFLEKRIFENEECFVYKLDRNSHL